MESTIHGKPVIEFKLQILGGPLVEYCGYKDSPLKDLIEVVKGDVEQGIDKVVVNLEVKPDDYLVQDDDIIIIIPNRKEPPKKQELRHII